MSWQKISDIKSNVAKPRKILLYGAFMKGKTTWAAQFPNCAMLSTDGNFDHMDLEDFPAAANTLVKLVKDTNVIMVGNTKLIKSGWQVFKEEIDNLIASTNVKTIVIDLVKHMHEMCRMHVLKSKGLKHESEDKRMGVIWDEIEVEFEPVLRKLMTCDKHVILIAHEKTVKVNNKDTEVKPDLKDKLFNKIGSYVGVIARFQTLGEGETAFRTIKAAPSSFNSSGNRYGLTETLKNPTYESFMEALN